MDRISDLQDGLLLDILSRLDSTKEAIRTSVLSKRWEHLWPSVPSLTFHHPQNNNVLHPDPNFFSFVNHTLSQCTKSNLNKFQLCIPFFENIKSEVSDWICHATTRNVKELDLSFPYAFREEECSSKFEFDPFFYRNSCFTQLNLGRNCVLNPTGAISWNKLQRLYMYGVELDEDLILNILSGSPLLETLELKSCYGFSRIDITSKSVKNLVFFSYFDHGGDSMEICAPHIQSLTIRHHLWLRKFVLHDVSSLVKAKLDYNQEGRYYVTRDKEEAEEEMLKGLISSLRHVKELMIGTCCLKVLSRLEAKGSVFPSGMKLA